jgi:hypothetical protein
MGPQGQGSPAQSAYASALQALQGQQQPAQPGQNGSVTPTFQQPQGGGAVPQGNSVAQALQADPRYQQVIGQIGHFLGLAGHPLAGAFNALHGLGQQAQMPQQLPQAQPAVYTPQATGGGQ